MVVGRELESHEATELHILSLYRRDPYRSTTFWRCKGVNAVP